MKLVCNKCGYRFESERVPEVCPYCGERGAITREKSAQEIIDEVAVDTDKQGNKEGE